MLKTLRSVDTADATVSLAVAGLLRLLAGTELGDAHWVKSIV